MSKCLIWHVCVPCHFSELCVYLCICILREWENYPLRGGMWHANALVNTSNYWGSAVESTSLQIVVTCNCTQVLIKRCDIRSKCYIPYSRQCCIEISSIYNIDRIHMKQLYGFIKRCMWQLYKAVYYFCEYFYTWLKYYFKYILTHHFPRSWKNIYIIVVIESFEKKHLSLLINVLSWCKQLCYFHMDVLCWIILLWCSYVLP